MCNSPREQRYPLHPSFRGNSPLQDGQDLKPAGFKCNMLMNPVRSGVKGLYVGGEGGWMYREGAYRVSPAKFGPGGSAQIMAVENKR